MSPIDIRWVKRNKRHLEVERTHHLCESDKAAGQGEARTVVPDDQDIPGLWMGGEDGVRARGSRHGLRVPGTA